jgi:hypothetical protein
MVYYFNSPTSGHYQSSCFYLKLNTNLQLCPYLIGNTLRLRYELNRLMLSIGVWRWYINITITIVGIIHRSVFYLNTRDLGDWILSPTNIVLKEDRTTDNSQGCDSYITFDLISFCRCDIYGPPLWSSDHSSWLQIQRSRVRFPELPDFQSSGSGTGST